MSDTDKIVKYIKLCRRRGIDVEPPHINHSDYKFTVRGETLYYSLAAIKGVGQSAVEAILEARAGIPEKKFESIDHFFEVVDLRRVNKKVIECLIKAGAFDNFGYHRSQLLAGYEKFVDAAETKRQDREVGQVSLFSVSSEEEQAQEKVVLPDDEAWGRMTRLSYEKEVLGFFLSDHPLNGYEGICAAWANTTVSEIDKLPNKSKVTLVGMVTQNREIITKKGTRMAFVQFEDLTAPMEVIVFPNTFADYEEVLKQEVPLVISGILEKKDENPKIIADKITTLADSINRAKSVIFRVDSKMEENLSKLRTRIDENPGETRVKIVLNLESIQKKVMYDIRDPKGIHLTNDFLEGLQKDFGGVDFIDISQ
jgi:DNA polymerase-3 subunit alpha